MLQEYEIYTHKDPNITTVTDLLNNPNGMMAAFKGKKQEFLDYDGGTNASNKVRIYLKYSNQEALDNPIDTDIELLKPNTQLLIPKDLMTIELEKIRGINQFVKQKDFNAFYGQSLLQLLKDPLYKQKIRYSFDNRRSINYNDTDSFTSIFPHLSVWIYVGSLDKILNVSKFINNCSTSVNKQSGSFQFNLPSVVSVDSSDLYGFSSDSNNPNEYTSGYDEFYSNNNLIKENGTNNEFYFHKIIQNNDIVFIKFEELELEKERRNDFIIDKSSLPNQIYDMIGLVDTNSKSTSFADNDVTITITGRNFMKLLIDDGSYFFPLLFIEGSQTTFINLQEDDKLLKRTFSTGNYDLLFANDFRSISDTLQFIINQLANLGVVGEDENLFVSYGDRVTKAYRLENETGNAVKKPLTGVWQITKLLIDETVKDRRLADSSASQPNGSLINQFQKICQEPFVEFFMDNYGDFTNLIVRQPPFTKSQINSVLKGTVTDKNLVKAQNEGLRFSQSFIEQNTVDLLLSIEPEDVISEDIEWESDQIYSWYQLDPRGAFLGQKDSTPLAYLPIIYFPQYANKWGCRRLSYVTNYISARSLTGDKKDIDQNYLLNAVINDYIYMLNAHTYLPFTRKARITINGDRRFKMGTWIRHKGTGEIYYVDSVSNNFSISRSSIDRTTTLNLSRGMVEKYVIYKKEYNKTDISYFNLVDTKVIEKVLIEQLTQARVEEGEEKTDKVNKPKVNVKSNFLVNQEVFNFFYQRQQFE